MKTLRHRDGWRWSRWRWATAGPVVLLLLVGCAAPLSITLPRAGPDSTCVVPAPDAGLLVGVALSGGGSRAALFGEAGLEALARLQAPGGGSVLERVMYLSSVSGGGLPVAYYAKYKPPRETPILTPAGTLTEAYQAFFTQYRQRVEPGLRARPPLVSAQRLPLAQLGLGGAFPPGGPRGALAGDGHVRRSGRAASAGR